MGCQNTWWWWWLSTLRVTAICYHGVSTYVAVYKQQTRRCPNASSAAALTLFFLLCDVSEWMQSTRLSIFLFRKFFITFWLQVQKEGTFFTKYYRSFFSLVFIAHRSSSTQRENRQSSYVCLSARKGREAFISRDICCGDATVLL